MDLDGVRDGELRDHADPAEIVESERAFAGKVWDIRRDRFRFGGNELVREYVEHPGAVAVLPMDEQGRVLLINQYRHPVRSREWELPAGLLDVEGEPPLEAARRELAEEVDLEAADWSELVRFATSPGGSDEVLHVFLARGLRDAPDTFARAEEEAEIVTRWVPLEEAVAAVLDGRLANSILIIAVLAAHARRS
ncbi:NUDIX domain-containing protein [Homoserinibacter sp. YIM 151385]|uniref:NUDIX domain-containing protein n=1 Tax=Homoserinibacter sp. YIM 151385 TaxID=2985506 RepID=UPI0022F056F0|nr:NUDIX hydrolase [Homoserinibacter sp. YIM 151385]WBU38851.1 NUDIX hydrolase [Homoserinibacter sp. YIM 151385]